VDLAEKIRAAQTKIEEVLSTHSAPVVMVSFGKDSMALLHLLRSMGQEFPVLFHREPFNPLKYQFANRIIEEYNLTVYDYPPMTTAVNERDKAIEIVNFYQVRNQLVYLPTGIRAPEGGKPFLCGLMDLYCRPLGSYTFPWDLAFVAHKSTDVDPILGPAELKVDIKSNPGSCDYAFPLRHFSDADVWEYHQRFKVPINTNRYDPANGYREKTDITWNNDWHHCCTLCLSKSSPPTVSCPKFQMDIPNLSALVRRCDDFSPDYFGTQISTAAITVPAVAPKPPIN
jgi:hypothetical protein